MRTILICFGLMIVSLKSYSQDCLKLKVLLIDSSSFLNYYHIKAKAKDGSVKSVFARKDNYTHDPIVKVGRLYSLILEEFNRDSLANGTPNIRGPYGLYVDGIIILGATEIAYYSKCLIGVRYKKCCK